ncbi:hypothetical protein J6590_019937 [Homalodisca vitripennis]|nr:hypothetical protein J6590_059293 [Homalodisca vitripennis]KAG8290043.1 hypothetical protein J6590_091597 [Homalodisca vitripennis]KAG8324681.1 hypothetical protein J6590_086676 [Homalodisca vitripennis]KAG8337536.1 hypothetical protein J6590_019937 [Homalodisca vitripennis]
MRLKASLCVFLVVAVIVSDGKKSFSLGRRKSGGSSRRSGSVSQPKQPAPAPGTSHTGSVNTNFLNSERAGSSHGSGSVNTHYRGNLFGQDPPKHNVPQTNGPIGFEKVNNPNQNLGFGKVNSEVQQKPGGSHVPSAPAYPGGASYPGKPPAGAPNGPPPAYPGIGSPGTHTGGYEPPPAYPGRPVNAPPVYSANNPNYGQRPPGQPGVGGYPQQQGAYPQSPYPVQPGGYQQGNYHPQTSYQGHNIQGQQNFGYPNTGNNFGSYPHGYNQGFGSYQGGGFGGSHPGGYGQSYPGYGGGSYGGSPFGHSNSFGGSPFSPGFGGNSYGGSSFGNPHYSPNNFGFSNSPGIFGSQKQSWFGGGGYNNYGYHKRSRFGGLPIPIPIPIPIPFGGFGGFGGRSYNHHVLDSFVKNKTINNSDNETTSVYILNNSTVTPCTTDQFIYDSLNVTVMSCTAGNCTAIKVFTTTNVSGEVSEHSAAITMCLEPNATYSTHADNINPTVSDVHRYWMRLCKVENTGNVTGNTTETDKSAVEVVETILNETVVSVDNTTLSPVQVNSSEVVETTTEASVVVDSSTVAPTISNSTLNESSPLVNSTLCEVFDCSWIEMCLPSIEIVDRCDQPECSSTRTGYLSCVRIKMCKSPTTSISTFATLNTTISKIDQFDNITSVNDVANLTLISYIPPELPANCSEGASDPACQPPSIIPEEVCAPSNSTETTGDGSTSSGVNPSCVPPTPILLATDPSSVDVTTTDPSSTTPIR